MFEFNPDDPLNEEFFRRAIKSYSDFFTYIKDQNKTPISTSITREVLNNREMIFEQGQSASEHFQVLT